MTPLDSRGVTGGGLGDRHRLARRRPSAVALWTTAISLLLLGPALAPGYVLTYDMVWVPDLALRPDALGTGSGLPRAVPSDAVVALADEIVPGMVLQKLMLLGVLVTGGLGAARLAERWGGLGTVPQCLAAAVFVWNPFVVERLLIGHWPVLLSTALLPWLVLAGREARDGARIPLRLLVLVPLASLSASAGITAAVVVLAVGIRRDGRPRATRGLRRGVLRGNAWLVGVVGAANLPWLVAGLLHVSTATSQAAAATLFATRAEGPLPAPLTALGLGGIWNAQTVPTTREGPLAVVGLVVLILLVALGLGAWWRAAGRRDALALTACWGLGWGLAVLSWAAPGAIGWIAAEVPGGGLLRDGSRLLGLCLPLVAVAAAHGGQRIVAVFGSGWQRGVVAGALMVTPLALLPDAAWGVSGRLEPVAFPASYAEVRRAVGDAEGADLLVLPFSSFRAPAWNDGRTVLDPLGRYLRPDYVASDELVVSGEQIAGEDPRAEEVRRALGARTPRARSAALAELGIGVVVRDSSARGPAPALAGERTLRAGDLSVVTLADPAPRPMPSWWWPALLPAWAGWLALPLVAAVAGLVRMRRRPPADC